MNDVNSILFVCLGNICRSPTAEAIMREKANRARLAVEIDSAGTSGYHIGDRPDPRSIRAGEKAGYSFKGQSARQITADDFHHFDLILAMDESNLSELQSIKPTNATAEIKLCLSYHPASLSNVPDPYYGGTAGFQHVIELIEEALDNLIATHWP